MSGNFGMFSDAGGRLVLNLINNVVANPMTTTDDELLRMIVKEMNKIEAKGHREVWDTDVREQMIGRIESLTKRELTIYL